MQLQLRNHFFEKIKNDPSAQSLLLANIASMVLALVFNWNILTVMWLYWTQSIMIGFFTFVKILLHKNNSKFFVAPFFAVHYGFFHLGYMVFLIMFSSWASDGQSPGISVAEILLVLTLFFLNHLYSFMIHMKKNQSKRVDEIMMTPYARIIPMHLTIMFGGFFLVTGFLPQIVLILFMTLKTGADLVMHEKKHENEEI